MEAAPIYKPPCVCSACQCPGCGNADQGGVCKVDKGDCKSAQKTRRCPVVGCINWTPKNAGEDMPVYLRNMSTFTSPSDFTIADKVWELREAFREQYGVDASISINIFSSDNPQLTRETAERLGREMAKVFPGALEMGHQEGEVKKWFTVDPPSEEQVDIALFYKEEPHEQSN